MAPEAEPKVDGEVTDPNSPQQDPTPSSGANGDQPKAPAVDKDTVLPDEHPLIVKHTELKGKLAKANTDLAEARAQAAKATQLEQDLNKRPTPEALETLQTRYDRLEAFLQQAGGPLARALDSRTFTKALFESDEDIKDLVKEWNRANPTATSSALGAAPGQPAAKPTNMNELIRAAAK